jgi:phosphoglycerate dehydrogenase-like enzyme
MPNTLVVEDDRFLRIVQVALDPNASRERIAAFTDFFAHDEPDFAGWCAKLRAKAQGLYPAEVRLVETQDELRENLATAHALIVESLSVDESAIAAAPRLKAVQKYGVDLRRIDSKACAAKGVTVLTLRRRANIACAELALTLMLMLARRVNELQGRISAKALAELGGEYKPFDRRHTPNSNWGRVPGLSILYGTTVGIVGLGEIGREFAQRAASFGMRILYTQRHQAAAAIEQLYKATYRPMQDMLAESDWVALFVPSGPATRNLFGRAELEAMKPGARLINISRAEVVDRAALLEALQSGRLGGFGLDPLYETPGRGDDELLELANVIMTPHIAAQPRFNALNDLDDMITGVVPGAPGAACRAPPPCRPDAAHVRARQGRKVFAAPRNPGVRRLAHWSSSPSSAAPRRPGAAAGRHPPNRCRSSRRASGCPRIPDRSCLHLR